MSNRRQFLVFAAGAAAWPMSAEAQQGKVPLVVVVSPVLASSTRQAILQGLQDYGYIAGKNIAVEFLEAPTFPEMPSYAAQAVARHPDLILASSVDAIVAVRDAAPALPVVFTNVIDPVALGLVSNLAHPGGNMTGNTILGAPLAGKALELLRDLVPAVTRIALFETSSSLTAPVLRDQMRAAGAVLGIDFVPIDVKNLGEDFAPYFEQAKATGAQALFISGYLTNGVQSGPALYDLSLRGGWPTVATAAVGLERGGLLSYGANNDAVTRRAGYYIDQILRGANPGSLAVELPTMFEFVLNLRTAKALGISIPPSVLIQATRVIS